MTILVMSPHSHLALCRFLFIIREEGLLLVLIVQIRRPAVGHTMTIATGAIHITVTAALRILARSGIRTSWKDILVI